MGVRRRVGGGLSIFVMFFYVNNLNSVFFPIICTLKLQSNSIDSFHSVKLYDVFFVVVVIMRIMYCSL